MLVRVRAFETFRGVCAPCFLCLMEEYYYILYNMEQHSLQGVPLCPSFSSVAT